MKNKNKIDKKYRQSEKGKAKEKRYAKSVKGKAVQRKSSKKYMQTEKGKIFNRKKEAKRRRNLGFIILIENQFNCDVDYHHINDTYVVAVPRYIHQGTLGKNHRVECNKIVEKLYSIDIEKEVEKYESKI
jgi:hypothetical protein